MSHLNYHQYTAKMNALGDALIASIESKEYKELKEYAKARKEESEANDGAKSTIEECAESNPHGVA